MTNRIMFWGIIIMCVLPSFIFGQEIKLVNGSFEDAPQHSTIPFGWNNCGDLYESPPDVQPGWFDVTTAAAKGKSFLGLVTRDNDTWEGISQRLAQPIAGGECYKFSIYLARSPKYVSLSKSTLKEENFNEPVRLRIWGGNSHCHKRELLAETSPISHETWKKYNLEFKPTMEHKFIFVEAYFKKGAFFPYNGNLLIDDMSSIKACKMPDDKDGIVVKPIEAVPAKKPKDKPTVTDPFAKKEEPVDVVEDVKKFDKTKIKKGTVIRTEGIQFDPDKYVVKESSFQTLDDVYDILKSNQDIVIEVGGHTNNIPDHAYCDRLSAQRAKAVADYLIKKGVDASRISYKGYGKRNPITTNETKEGRLKNQRVEIKILDFDN